MDAVVASFGIFPKADLAATGRLLVAAFET
jgi:hypothetical protein